MNEKLGPFSKCAAVRQGRQSRGWFGLLGSSGACGVIPSSARHCCHLKGLAHMQQLVVGCARCAAAGMAQRQHVLAFCPTLLQGHVSMKPKRGDAIVFHSQKVGPLLGLQRICQRGGRWGCSLPAGAGAWFVGHRFVGDRPGLPMLCQSRSALPPHALNSCLSVPNVAS